LRPVKTLTILLIELIMIILFSENAQLELRSARHENVQLRKQFYDSHQSFVEKTSKLENQLQSVANYGPKTVQVRAWNVS